MDLGAVVQTVNLIKSAIAEHTTMILRIAATMAKIDPHLPQPRVLPSCLYFEQPRTGQYVCVLAYAEMQVYSIELGPGRFANVYTVRAEDADELFHVCQDAAFWVSEERENHG